MHAQDESHWYVLMLEAYAYFTLVHTCKISIL